MSLLDRLVPASALRWGPLTTSWPWVVEHGMGMGDVPPGVIVRCFLPGCQECIPAMRDTPDPAALWGEHDRRAEGEQ